MRKLILFILPLIFSASCSLLKTAKLMKQGAVKQTTFKTEIPFEMRLGLIILKVNVNGIPCDFVLDTGAPNVISKELAQKLNLLPATSRKAGDSQGNKSSLGFASINTINIGGIDFTETGAAIADLKQSNEVACLKIEGFIGSNLMRKAIWQFDYERRIISITNNRDSLKTPSSYPSVKFKPALTGTPIIDLHLNGITEKDVFVDLGSNGDFGLSMDMFNTLKKDKSLRTTYSYGNESSGLYGNGSADTTKYALVNSLNIGGVNLQNVPVMFSNKKVKTVGTNFFKNYRLIIDWAKGELIMLPVKPYNELAEKHFKVKKIYRDHKLFIGLVFEGEESGLKLGDQVLEADGVNYRECLPETCWCDVMTKTNLAEKSSLLILRDGKEMRVEVAKELLFK